VVKRSPECFRLLPVGFRSRGRFRRPPWSLSPLARDLRGSFRGQLSLERSSRVHPLLSLSSTSECITTSTCPPPDERLPWGSLTPFATSGREVHHGGTPRSASYVPFPVFRTLSTAFSLSPLAGIFVPLPRMKFSRPSDPPGPPLSAIAVALSISNRCAKPTPTRVAQ
jgi:hypothetical protein